MTPKKYDEISVLMKEVVKVMLDRLDVVALKPKCILDAGCGTGYSTTLLKKRYPDAYIVALDDSLPMVAYAKNKTTLPAQWMCSYPEELPLKTHSVDMIIANLILPWRHEVKLLLGEWQRVLRPEGVLMLSSLGLETLTQVVPRDCLIPTLIDMHDLGDALMKAHFQDPIMDVEHFSVSYQSSDQMKKELPLLGFLSLDKQDHVKVSLERVNAEFEIIYGHAWGGDMLGFSTDKEGIVKIPLAELRRNIRGRIK